MLSIMTIYVSLLVWSFLAATIVPLTSDGVLIYMVMNGHNVAAIIAIATVGSFLGSSAMYFLGLYGRKKITQKYDKIEEKNLEYPRKIFERYGTPSLLFTWLPVIGDALVVVAGFLGIKFSVFSAYALIGKLLKYSILAYVALSLAT